MIGQRIRQAAATEVAQGYLGENILFSIVTLGVFGLLAYVIHKGVSGWDVAACLMVLQQVINAVRERHPNRSIDRLGDQLGASTPHLPPLDLVEGLIDGEPLKKA